MGTAKISSYPTRLFCEHNNNEESKNEKSGRPVLQHCENCGTIQYPSREVCRTCLSGNLVWKATADDTAIVASHTRLHHSLEEQYLERDLLQNPWHIVTVCLSSNSLSGSTSGSILVHSAKPRSAGDIVRLVVIDDSKRDNAAALLAVSPGEDANAVWQELSNEASALSDANK